MRKQWSLQTGYSNLFDPVIKRHPDFVATVLASVTNNATLVGFIDHKSQTVFCWIDWTTTCNLPFSWCEDGTVTKYTTLARISTEALLKYATLVVREIEIFIGLVIPVKIGIMLDGCTFKSEHVLAVFAVFEPDRRVDKVLLAFAPLIYDDATDHTAASPVKKFTDLRPVLSQETRWDTTYKMVKRFFAIKDVIDTTDDDVAELMPTCHEENKLLSLQEDLRDFKYASKKL
ncbi:hypothetical protein PF010_g12156 [Phytophthora fragariae]|uniref:Uncharacterized protein n=1 Tax=Phytophthora fragariae TaxID=53985 RepID=A0A6G0L4B6_9STRA|nr:hypothetical protein PF010_g12156 [Phytophthora fragariae]